MAAPAVKLKQTGYKYCLRTWIEYALKQSKDPLAWVDFRITHYEQIQKWWVIVISAFVIVSLFADAFNDSCPMAQHPW